MPARIRKKNRPILVWERKYLACKTCGQMFSSENNLRIHKSKMRHWASKQDKVLMAKVEIAFEKAQRNLSIPTAPAIAEVADSPVRTEIVESDKKREVSIATLVNESIGSYNKSVRLTKKEHEKIRRRAEKIPFLIGDDGLPNEYLAKIVPEEIKSESDTIQFIDPKTCNIKQIYPGSILLLSGYVFKRDSNSFSPFQLPNPIEGIVKKRWSDTSGEVYLDVSTDDGNFVCNELLVIPVSGEPRIKLLQYGKHKELYTKKSVGTDAESLNFLAAVSAYYQAAQNLAEAKITMRQAERDHKYVISKYLEEYGLPSVENAKDHLIKDAGYRVHYTFEKPEDGIYVKEDVAVTFLIQKGLTHCLKSEYVFNEDVWEHLKEMKIFSEEELAEIEYIEQKDPVRSIIIERLEK